MHLKIDPPRDGWISVTLLSFGEVIQISASNTPGDSIMELAKGVLSILKGTSEVTVPWNTKFIAYDFFFVTNSKRTILSIIEFPHHSRDPETGKILFKVSGNQLEMCLSLWHSLCQLEKLFPSGEEYTSAWDHPFPSQILKEITTKILEDDPLILKL